MENKLENISQNVIPITYKLVEIRGVLQNPTFDKDFYEDIIDNFIIKNNDTFLVTYVKAGTTWIQQVIHLLLNKGEQGYIIYDIYNIIYNCYYICK